MQYRKLVKGAIRLPIIFFGLNIMLKCKKQTNITFFVKLSILNYRCPGETILQECPRRGRGAEAPPDSEFLSWSEFIFWVSIADF